ncbi:MAG: hypothetical protein ACYTDT_03880 [Planctomycetota bacterium]|jgi:hypothetical protein
MSTEFETELDFIESTLHELASWTRDQMARSEDKQSATEKIDMIQVALMKLHMIRNSLGPDGGSA